MVEFQNQPHIRSVPANGIELSVAEYGTTGPSLVLLHGIGSRHVSWMPVVDQLANRFHLIVPDFRGHGDSDKPATGYLFTDYANDVEALLSALEIERPLIMGHSLGALTALTWASSHPSKAAKIVLEDPPTTSGRGDEPMLEGWLRLAKSSIAEVDAYYQEQFPEWTAEERHRRAVSITSTAPGVFQDLLDQIRAGGYADWLQVSMGIETPILLIHGEPAFGSSTKPEIVKQFEANLRVFRSVQIPGGGHSLHRDNTDAFLDAVLPFLLEGET